MRIYNIIRKKLKIPGISLSTRRSLTGLGFVSLFLFGFIIFLLVPIIQSIIFSISNINITTSGFYVDYVGLEHYEYLFYEHPKFARIFVETIINTLVDIPVVIMFSFFIAVVLNQKFKGRMLFRIIFFLPVIFSAKIIRDLEARNFVLEELMGGASMASPMSSEMADPVYIEMIRSFFLNLRLPEDMIMYVLEAVERLPGIIDSSAIPILIFLAALQSIPSSLYEVSEIEGATRWETFWKITFPLVSPLFLTNVVYIVVDSFTSRGNPLVKEIQSTAWGKGGYPVSSAMSWIYFVAIIIILAITIGIISRRVFYME